LRETGEGWQLTGDPTEGALLTLALKAGLELRQSRAALPRVDVIPFESEHRFMATLNHDHEGRGFIYLKGAPERVLALCTSQRRDDGDTPLDPEAWHARMNEAAAQGMRLLALAVRRGDAGTALSFDDIAAGGFTLLAVLGLTDPPREEAIRAVAACRAAGIRVKMITGDHVATAQAIAASSAWMTPCGEDGAEIEPSTTSACARWGRGRRLCARQPGAQVRLIKACSAGGNHRIPATASTTRPRSSEPTSAWRWA